MAQSNKIENVFFFNCEKFLFLINKGQKRPVIYYLFLFFKTQKARFLEKKNLSLIN